MRHTLLCRSLAVPLLAFLLAGPAQAAVIPLQRLNQPILREQVRSFLVTKDAAVLMAPIAPLVNLRADQIIYEAADGRPTRLVWGYQPRRPLTPADRTLIRNTLAAILYEAVRTHLGGLLNEADSAALRTILVAEPADTEPPATAARPAEPRVVEPPNWWMYRYADPVPGYTGYGLYPAYTSSWPTYGAYRGAYYWPMLASGNYALGYTPWVYGIYPWAFDSWPVASAWSGPYYYAFRGTYQWWRGYAFPWGIPYFTPAVAAATPAAIGATLGVRPAVTAVLPPPATVPVAVPSLDPITLYSRARSSYRNREFTEALTLIDRAVELNPDDPRFWYIKAAIERTLGRAAAEQSAQRAAAVEVLERPDPLTIGEALETIQGRDREWLRNVGRLSMTLDTARQLASAPVRPGLVKPPEPAPGPRER